MSTEEEHFVHYPLCSSNVKIFHGGRSNIKVHLDMFKHSENLHIRNCFTFSVAYIFNVTCKHILKIHLEGKYALSFNRFYFVKKKNKFLK